MSRGTGWRPVLPWGHWLTTMVIDDISYFVDEDGRAWSSVRKAFWWGSLGMPNDSSGVFDRDLEHFFGVLAAIDRRRPPRRETVVDMFEGDGDYHRFYLQWLVSVGIMNPRVDVFSARLSRAGREVLMMLAATRPQPLWSVPIGPGSPAALTPSHPRDAARERWFDETDAVAIGLRYRFMRDVVHGKWAIKLLGDTLGGTTPAAPTLWSHLFDEEEVRDRFHHWLCVRLDRWMAWGRLAHERGASELTQRLLTLMTIELTRGDDIVASLLPNGDGRRAVEP